MPRIKKKVNSQWVDEALLKIERAKKRGKLERATQLYAVKAAYDSKSRQIVIDLANGSSFSFPPKLAEGLARKSAEALAVIEISPMGTGLYWPKLDVDLTVEGLLSGVFGGDQWMLRQHLAKAGRVKSIAKAKSSRENGAKGGRPKKKVSQELLI